MLAGARGGPAVDIAALAALAAAAGELLLSEGLELLELNPVIATPAGAVAVDALAAPVAGAPSNARAPAVFDPEMAPDARPPRSSG